MLLINQSLFLVVTTMVITPTKDRRIQMKAANVAKFEERKNTLIHNCIGDCIGDYEDSTKIHKSCVTFSAGRWKKTHTLGQPRYGHTGWASPRGVMLMGGHGGNRLTTTELLTDNGGATPSFNLNYERQ